MPRSKSAARVLLGTWRSDRKRTIAQWIYPKRLADDRRKHFEAIFGKLRYHYTATTLTSKLGARVSKGRYKILWSQEGPIFPQILILVSSKDGEAVQHVYFDSPNSFYIHAGKCIEFFKRVRSNKSLQRTRAR